MMLWVGGEIMGPSRAIAFGGHEDADADVEQTSCCEVARQKRVE